MRVLLIEESLPPVVTNPGTKIIEEGVTVNLQIEATDPNAADILSYSSTGLPSPLSIDPVSGLISGTIEDDIGEYTVTVTVTDPLGLQGEETFTINVIPGPAPPVLASINDQELEELASIDVPISANDINGDPITLSIASSPTFASLDDLGDGTGTLTIAPQLGDEGVHQLTVRAEDDGGLFNETTITITVTLGPRAPELTAIADPSVVEEATLDVPISATDANGDPITLSIAAGPSFASLVDVGDGTGTLTLSPQAGDEGEHLLTVRAEDDGGLFNEITITITVIKAPTAPELAPIDEPSVAEESILDVPISATDANGDPIILSITTGPAFITIDDLGDGTGTLTLAPQFGDEGQYQLTVRAEDGGGLFDETTITVTVIKGPTAPTLSVIADQSLAEGASIDIALSATDVNDDPITLGITAGPAFATINDLGDGTGTLTLAPQFGDEGEYQLTVRAEDIGGLFDEGTITITVIKGPTAPQLITIDDQNIAEGSTLDIAVSAVDANADPITLSIISGPSFTTLDDLGNGTGTITLAPQPGDEGEYQLTVRAEDDGGLFDEITITITVIKGPTAPEFTTIDDPSVAEEATVDVTIFATDANGDPITLSIIAGPSFATLNDQGNGTGTLTLAPEVGDEGEYQLTLRAEDDGGLFVEIAITITVIKGPAAPILGMLEDPSLAEGSTQDINISAIDPNGDPIILSIIAGPTFASLNDQGNGTGTLTLTPQVGDEGTYQLTIRAEDNGGLFDETTINITVIKGPAAPVLGAIDDQNLLEGSAVDIALSATDANGGLITLSIASGPSFVSLDDQGNGIGTLTISPQAGDEGGYQVTIRAEDNGGLFDEITFNVTVNKGPSAPVLAAIDNQTVAENASIDLGVSATDANGDPITLSITSGPSFVSLDDQGNGNGTLTISPQAGDEGGYQVTVRAEDDGGLFDEITFNVTVNKGPSAPVLAAIDNQTVAENTSVDVAISATDANGDPITLSITSGPSFVSLNDQGNGNGTLTISPQAGDEGAYQVTIRAEDNGGLFDEKTITVNVLKGQSAPVFSDVDDQDVTTGVVVEVPISATDPNGDPITFTPISGPSFVSLNDLGNGQGLLTISPQTGDEGAYQVTIRATDSNGDFSEKTISINITKSNTEPVLVDINDQTLIEGTSLEVGASASDIDGDIITLTLVSGPSFVTLNANGNGTGAIIISPNFGEVGNYSITVQATDPGGLFDQKSFDLEVSENTQVPDWNVEASITNASCSGEDGSIILEVSGGLGQLSYQWSHGAQTKDINGLSAGNYQVEITDEKSNSTSRSYVVNSDPGPSKPDVNWDGSVLNTTSDNVSYQWYNDGLPIEGADKNTYLPSESGSYRVSVTDDKGCNISSDEIFAEYQPMEVKIYPNPIRDYFKLELVVPEAEEITVNLYNDRGRLFALGSFDLDAGRSIIELDIERLLIPEGVYNLRIISNQLPLQHHRVMIFR